MLKLDKFDIAILETLQKNGRITKLELSQRIGLSQTPCYSRIKRLEQHKLIQRYRAEVDLARVARFTTIFVTVVLERHQAADFQQFEREVKNHPQIVECHALGGGIDYLLKIVETDIEAYQELIESLLEAPARIGQYYTYVVTKSVVTDRGLPIGHLLET